jgi:hypothetical protein
MRASLDATLLGELEGCCEVGLAGGLPNKLRVHGLPALFPDLHAVAVSGGLTHAAPNGKAPGDRIPGESYSGVMATGADPWVQRTVRGEEEAAGRGIHAQRWRSIIRSGGPCRVLRETKPVWRREICRPMSAGK